MAKLAFFDAEHVDRETPARPWRAIVFAALSATAALTAGYEFFWRAKGLEPGDYNNTQALWAEARRAVTPESTVLIGSSRIFFDTDLDAWEKLTGKRPVQLALEGTSPRLFLGDLADDDSFHGLVVVGVTAPLFFGSEGGRRAEVLKYARTESSAQKSDQFLMKRLEGVFAFIDEQSRPKRQIEIWQLPLRAGMPARWDPRKIPSMGPDRNAQMWSRIMTDEGYREEVKFIWTDMIRRNTPPPGPDGRPAGMPDAAVDAVIAEVKANIDRIRARGGDVAFARYPYSGPFAVAEDNGFPRARFWDRLVTETDSAGVAWQDHEALQGYDLPEWSHLAPADKARYTNALVPLLEAEIEKARARR